MKIFLIIVDIFLVLSIFAMKIAEDNGYLNIAKIISHIFTIMIVVTLIICYFY